MKKILFLGYKSNVLIDFLRSFGHEVVVCDEKLNLAETKVARYDFLVSYGYLHIVEQDILDLFPRAAVNLHISLLPYNRGKDPNFWSFVENTPNGVSVHYMNAGLDKGEIISQKRIIFDPTKETFSSSYLRLRAEIETLFMSVWHDIEEKKCIGFAPTEKGTYHRAVQKEKYMKFLDRGWDTPISDALAKIKSSGE